MINEFRAIFLNWDGYPVLNEYKEIAAKTKRGTGRYSGGGRPYFGKPNFWYFFFSLVESFLGCVMMLLVLSPIWAPFALLSFILTRWIWRHLYAA